jgi:hypothetical protein
VAAGTLLCAIALGLGYAYVQSQGAFDVFSILEDESSSQNTPADKTAQAARRALNPESATP